MVSRRATTLLVCIVLAVLVATGIWLRVSVYRIASGSMEPEFPVGSIVIDSSVVPLEPGRAVTFVADGSVVTHVFTGYGEDGSLITRGTANATDDSWRTPVYTRDVRGRVLFGIPLTAPSFWTQPRGVVTAAAIGVGAFTFVLWRYARRVEREVSPAQPRLHKSSK